MGNSVINTLFMLIILQPCIRADHKLISIKSSILTGDADNFIVRNISIVKGPFLEAASIGDDLIHITERPKLPFINQSKIPKFKEVIIPKYPEVVPPASPNWFTKLLILFNMVATFLLFYVIIKKIIDKRSITVIRLPSAEQGSQQNKITHDRDQSTV